MKKRSAIILHTDELDSPGVELAPLQRLEDSYRIAHRDDHYIFILQQKGFFLCEIDFTEVTLKGPACCFIAPGQVHRYLQQRNNKGWFIFVDRGLIASQYREVFDTCQQGCQLASVRPDYAAFSTVPILEQLLNEEKHSLKPAVIFSLTSAITGMIAFRIGGAGTSGPGSGSRKYHIAIRFRQLVRLHYKELKQVLQYAERLNITPLYLNEVMKEVTGFPASYWIQQETLLEAKRMLCYTELDVKQIAYELGYEDHAYFSRYFKKNTGITAVAFRTKNHDLSNQSH